MDKLRPWFYIGLFILAMILTPLLNAIWILCVVLAAAFGTLLLVYHALTGFTNLGNEAKATLKGWFVFIFLMALAVGTTTYLIRTFPTISPLIPPLLIVTSFVISFRVIFSERIKKNLKLWVLAPFAFGLSACSVNSFSRQYPGSAAIDAGIIILAWTATLYWYADLDL